jgi:hypothetical protein
VITKLEFILFYTLFVLFIAQISGMAGQSLLKDVPAFKNVPTDATSLLNPLTNMQFWLGMLTVSSDYQIIFTLILLPLIIGLVWSIIELVRGV